MSDPGKRIRSALLFSDVHLGWSICARHHVRLLGRLPEAADDAELIVLNGDVIDRHRRPGGTTQLELVQRLEALVAGWRGEGREVVYVEGNHDPIDGATGALRPDRWRHDFRGANDERIRVLHGHRFDDARFVAGPYERFGRHVIALENRLHDAALMRLSYRLGPGWLVGLWGLSEDRAWRPRLPGRVAPLLEGIDVLVHGHFHYGPGHGRIGAIPTWRSGAWVSCGHLGSVDRILRYRDGRFERLELRGDRWRPSQDGR
jgi:UDP-2,3-diacylglucosamine pyrophosphatase LpxH